MSRDKNSKVVEIDALDIEYYLGPSRYNLTCNDENKKTGIAINLVDSEGNIVNKSKQREQAIVVNLLLITIFFLSLFNSTAFNKASLFFNSGTS